MNTILHGIEAPNIIHTNTLTENLADIQDKDRFDVVLANPPFGGKERKEVQQNFPIHFPNTDRSDRIFDWNLFDTPIFNHLLKSIHQSDICTCDGGGGWYFWRLRGAMEGGGRRGPPAAR